MSNQANEEINDEIEEIEEILHDEKRFKFPPSLIRPNNTAENMKEVWFAGVHSDVGGSYAPDTNGFTLSDIPMLWMKNQAEGKGLEFQSHISQVQLNALAAQNNEYKKHYKLLGKHERKILPDTPIHISVKQRYEQNAELGHCKPARAWSEWVRDNQYLFSGRRGRKSSGPHHR